jgi:hypothetical protein
MVGAVGMALGIEYDRSGVLTFLVPGVIGIFILIGSWVSSNNNLKYFNCYQCQFRERAGTPDLTIAE